MKTKNPSARAQISAEFFTFVLFLTLVTLLIALVAYLSFGKTSEQMALEEAARSSKRIAELANDVYMQGEGSVASASVPIPTHVSNITIGGSSGREVVFHMKTSSGSSDIVAMAAVNITNGQKALGNYSRSGIRQLNLTRSGSKVVISVVT
ncbi:MAG: hypothetical protein AB1468_05050 [Candidatus Micrarchaeota archaeon]